jgi:hypothetical protein
MMLFDLNQPSFAPVMKNILSLLLLICCFSQGMAQESSDKATVSGYVKDSISGESLLGATIYIKEIDKGAVANTYGFFSLTSTIKGEIFTVLINFVGYQREGDRN